MSVPGVFAPVPFQDMLLADGGLMNNFPVNLAKKQFPRTKIIGIALNKFEENPGPKNLLDGFGI
jgi:predicted acylesterase/phospholipase RssA